MRGVLSAVKRKEHMRRILTLSILAAVAPLWCAPSYIGPEESAGRPLLIAEWLNLGTPGVGRMDKTLTVGGTYQESDRASLPSGAAFELSYPISGVAYFRTAMSFETLGAGHELAATSSGIPPHEVELNLRATNRGTITLSQLTINSVAFSDLVLTASNANVYHLFRITDASPTTVTVRGWIIYTGRESAFEIHVVESPEAGTHLLTGSALLIAALLARRRINGRRARP
jgi:hypothetical protein